MCSQGVKPDPSKVDAIQKMEPPKDVAAVRRLVGLVNYLSKFLSKLSELCEPPLRRLTHKDVEWRWSVEQEAAEAEAERIHAVDFLPILEPQLLEIQRETAADPVLRSLIEIILKGWPDRKENVPRELHPYFNVRDELTAQDGVLFKGLQSTSDPRYESVYMVHTPVLKAAFVGLEKLSFGLV